MQRRLHLFILEEIAELEQASSLAQKMDENDAAMRDSNLVRQLKDSVQC